MTQFATFDDVYRLCGWQAARKLFDVARGRDITIPRELPQGLKTSLGPLVAMRVKQRMGGMVVKAAPDLDLRQMRDREIRAAQNVHGLSIPEIVAEFGLSEFQVRDALSGTQLNGL